MKKIVICIFIACIVFVVYSISKPNDPSMLSKKELKQLQEEIPAAIGIIETNEDKVPARSSADFSSNHNIVSRVTGKYVYTDVQEHSGGKAYKIITSSEAVRMYSWVNASDVTDITADASPKYEEVEQFTLQLLSTLQKSYETRDSSTLAPFYNTSSSMYEYEVDLIEKMKKDETKVRIADFELLDILKHGNTYWPIVIVKYHQYWPNKIRRDTVYEYSIYNVQFHNEQPRIESLQLYFK